MDTTYVGALGRLAYILGISVAECIVPLTPPSKATTADDKRGRRMVTMETVKCPVCGSRDVRGGKYSVDSSGDRDINEYDLFCRSCHTLEARREDAPDFRTWKQRWTAPDQ